MYDAHNIFILPSFTEAHPKVVDESLARMRPVIIFEDVNLAGTRGEVSDVDIPFGKAEIVKEGNDCTIVGIAGSVKLSLEAANNLENEGISCEVINPRTLVPLDKETILNSVEKHLILIHILPNT